MEKINTKKDETLKKEKTCIYESDNIKKVYEFEVIGDIKGKARPRVNTYTCKAYTPTDTKDYENLIKLLTLKKI